MNTESQLFEILADMRDVPLRNFLKFVFSPEQLLLPYLKSPGSRNNHHSFEGGLAEHSVHCALLGRQIAAHYNNLSINVNTDIVVAGILLHDIGKIHCYSEDAGLCPNRTDWDGSDYKCGCDKPTQYHHVPRASLFHHIPMGAIDISKLADKFNESREKPDHQLTQKKVDKLIHIILSHHGRRSWSSPVIPQFVEAYIVHAVEMMDAYVDKYNKGRPPRDIYDH